MEIFVHQNQITINAANAEAMVRVADDVFAHSQIGVIFS